MKPYTLSVCIAMLFLNVGFTQKSLDIRLINNYYDESSHELYVDVDVRYTGLGELAIADQNYRIYFDSENLQLNVEDSRSDLPFDTYGPLNFLEVLEGVHVENINELDFDDNLGFVNFSIDLLDDLNGGIVIDKSSDWTRIAILKFIVKEDIDKSQIVWSQKGRTDAYASAFVEIMEWVSPNHTRSLEIEDYVNLNYQIGENATDINFKVGPNPAMDYIKVDVNEAFENNIHLSIIDNTGRRVKNQVWTSGSTNIFLDVSDLTASNYTLELYDDIQNQRVFTEKFILSK